MKGRPAILLIDHGSRRHAANESLRCVADLLRYLVRDALIVQHAHMELAVPSVAQGFAACVDRGASEVIAQPYMLAPGRHASDDIPRLVAEAASAHTAVTYKVSEPLGVHRKLAEVVLQRCNVSVELEPPAADAEDCTLEPENCHAPWCGPGE